MASKTGGNGMAETSLYNDPTPTDPPNRNDNLTEQNDPSDPEHSNGKTVVNDLNQASDYKVFDKAARSLIDISLLMANVSHLRTILDLGPENTKNFHLLLGLVIASLSLQIIFGILMVVLLSKKSGKTTEGDNSSKTEGDNSSKVKSGENDSKCDRILNNFSIFLVATITIINMFITGFGIRTKN